MNKYDYRITIHNWNIFYKSVAGRFLLKNYDTEKDKSKVTAWRRHMDRCLIKDAKNESSCSTAQTRKQRTCASRREEERERDTLIRQRKQSTDDGPI